MGEKCWICGQAVTEQAVGKNDEERAYLEVTMVNVNKPYSLNSKTGKVYICHVCRKDKVGMTYQCENINRRIHSHE
jgi:hypothetical protein